MSMNTLAAGAPLTSKYGRLGGQTRRAIAPPHKSIAFFFGLPGEGKSALMQSVPNSFLFNLDGSSTVSSSPRAEMWPLPSSSTGQLEDGSGQPIVLTHDLIMEKVAILKDLAKTNQPRPDTVIFDSLSTWLRLLIEWVPANAVKLGIRSPNDGPATSFRQLHGPAAWDCVYEAVVQTIADLKAHGYGVFLVGHVVRNTVPIGENLNTFTMDFTTGPGFWKRFFPLVELSVAICARLSVREVVLEQPQTVRGETRMVSRRQPISEKIVEAISTREDLAGMAKTRVNLPPIPLNPSDPWESFHTAYLAAAV